MKLNVKYFDKASMDHTETVINTVKEFLETSPNINYIVVATTRGETGLAVAKAFRNKEVIAVTHHYGFVNPNEIEISNEKLSELRDAGARVLTATHAFAGVGRGIRIGLGTYTIAEQLAVAFRTFGQGTKVCAEIALMAADAGLVPVDKNAICIAGTGRGADTAWLVQPANTNKFPKLRMKACLCKPIKF
jgi:hypothetical protein